MSASKARDFTSEVCKSFEKQKVFREDMAAPSMNEKLEN